MSPFSSRAIFSIHFPFETSHLKYVSDAINTALIIANLGQLVYHCGSEQAMSQRTWFALPVETAAHPPPRQTWRNIIPRNGNWREHVKCIFEDLLTPESGMVNPEAKIDIIGVEEGGSGAVEYLAENCKHTYNC